MARDAHRFHGFTDEALAFLAGLAADNSRAYFDANRAVYEREVRDPARALVVDLGEELRARIDPAIEGDPARGLFRINRDTRFAKDKTPYKTFVAMGFPVGASKRDAPALYLSVAPDRVGLGVGFTPPDPGAWRDAIADERSGAAFDATLARAVAASGEHPIDFGDPELTRVPRGYPADHPRAEWLRRKGIRLGRHVAVPDEIHSSGFVAWAADELEPYGDLLRWLGEHVASERAQGV